MPILLFFLFAIVIIVVAVAAHLAARKRREVLAAFARSRGLAFSADDPFDIPERYGDFGLMSQGHSRGASNVLWGDQAGREVVLFEYSYKTGSGKNETTHSYTGCLWRLPAPLASMAMRPEGLFDTVAEWFGFNDIDFESAEFSRRYLVKGDDRRGVYAVMTPRMIEFIMASDLRYLEIIGQTALVYSDTNTLKPELCDWLLGLARGFDAHIPEHVVRERTERAGGRSGDA